MITETQERFVEECNGETQTSILAVPTIEELRLKLMGASDRLYQIPDDYEKSDALISILHNFSGDMTQKIEKNLLQGDQYIIPY